MNNKCSKCGRPLNGFGECSTCEAPEGKSFGRMGALVATVIIIGVLLAGTIYLNKFISNPFQFMRKARKDVSFEVTKASKSLPVARKPKVTITLDQYAELQEYFKNSEFGLLNSALEAYQEEFETDVTTEYKVYDAYQVFSTTLPSYEDLFKSWLEYSPQRYAPYLARAHYYYQNGWESRGYSWAKDTSDAQFKQMRFYFQKAAKDIDAALEINPALMSAYRILIGIYNATGNDEGEDRTIETALELFPGSFLVRSIYMRAVQPRWGGSYAEMENFAKKAEEFSDLNPELTALYGFIYSDQGKIQKSKKKYKSAVNMYTKALSFGDNALVYHDRAQVYHYYLDESQKALADVERCLVLRPTLDKSYRLRSRIYYKLGDIDRALEDLDTAKLLKPEDAYTRKWRKWAAENLLSKGHRIFEEDLDQAIKNYTYSLRFNPQNQDTYYWRGVAFSRLQKLDFALRDLEKSIELNPQHFDSYLMLDYTLFQERKLDRIISYWDAFIEMEPDHARAYLERAGTYYHKKDYANSLKDLKNACDFGNEEGCKRYKRYKDKWQ